MAREKITIRTISTISVLFLFISLCFSLSAQQKTRAEKVLIGGKTYTLYTAASGDSPFAIARKFGISLDELNQANPGIKTKLNAGQTVRIPVVTVIESKPQIVNSLEKADSEDRLFIYHSVRKRETVFSIAQKSKITSEDIYYNNPQARDGIKEGDVLKIPKPQTFSNELKTTTIETKQPIKYIVGRRETLYSISNKFNVTQEAILKMNPTVKGALEKGTILLIPGSPVSATSGQENMGGEQKFSLYKIVNGDNFFQLQQRFGCSEEELIQLNPTLGTGIRVGMIIKIPIKESSGIKNGMTSQSPDSLINFPLATPVDLNKTFEIGVFLPFFQNLNDSSRIVQRTASFLEFYSGILLATEKMTESGMKLKLHVYDTYQDNKIVEQLVKKPEFLSLDLIIGPVYPGNQNIVAELSSKNRIPMVSPLSSDSRFVSKTPGYYQINPGKSIRVTGTADYIADKFAGQNIIVLNHGANSGDEKLIVDRLNQKLGVGKYRQYNILTEGMSGLEGMLKADQENVIVLTESNEANVSVSMTRLNTISKSNKIIVIGLQEYTKMQSIEIEYLHNVRLHYLSPYFIDFRNPKVVAFIEKYRAAFASEPSQYSFQGFDIALHFMASLGKAGKNFPATNPFTGVDLLQADYSFQKLSEFGGYINQTLYIIEYNDNYEVLSAGKIRGAVDKVNGEGKENEKNVF